jgi:cytochrome c553
MKRRLVALVAGLCALTSVVPAAAEDSATGARIQHGLVGSDFPIARAVEVPPGTQLLWHSGQTPAPANPEAERYSREFWGDTEAQALSVFERLEASLDDLGVGYEDIVKMTVFLVPDPENEGRMDFAGFMRAYTRYFGQDADHASLPARSAVGVAQLAAPGMLVEVEAIFARPDGTAAAAPAGAAEAPSTFAVGDDPFGFCITCHGTDGGGNPGVEAPRIGGMEPWYLERQLRGFRAGWRGVHEDDYQGNVMRTMALALADEAELEAAAAYFAALPVTETPDTVEGDVARGKQLYLTCVACHGAAAEGNVAMQSPALADQSDWYLVKQLIHFREGIRGAAPGDSYGAQMRAMAGTLATDQDVRDVVAYINSLD